MIGATLTPLHDAMQSLAKQCSVFPSLAATSSLRPTVMRYEKRKALFYETISIPSFSEHAGKASSTTLAYTSMTFAA